MPHASTHLEIRELHPTFAAEIHGVDFTSEDGVADDVVAEIQQAIIKYGVLRFPSTNLTDTSHVAFAAKFGDLDDVTPYTKLGKKHRLSSEQLFDVSNLLDDGSVAPLDSHRAAMNKGNSLFHVDSSFNPRRAGYSLLRAQTLPPRGTGGATEYADTRTAFEELSEEVKSELVRQDYVACHSLWHSRKLAAPKALADVKPEEHFMSRHQLVQRHEASGRMNLYIASHVHHIEGLPEEESRELIDRLYAHACQEKYVVAIDWANDSDLILWDNTCVMHRATGGSFEGTYVRDMRRATLHDASPRAWGLNEQTSERMGFP